MMVSRFKTVVGWSGDFLQPLWSAENDLVVFHDESSLFNHLQHHSPAELLLAAELEWREHRASDFYGMELVCRLRCDIRYTEPIVIASFMPEAWMRGRFPILDFRKQHPLVRWPADPAAVRAAMAQGESADAFRLQDIISSYCDPAARLLKLLTHGKFFHLLLNNQGRLSDAIREDLALDLGLLSQYTASLPMNPAAAETADELTTALRSCLQPGPKEWTKIRSQLTRLIAGHPWK